MKCSRAAWPPTAFGSRSTLPYWRRSKEPPAKNLLNSSKQGIEQVLAFLIELLNTITNNEARLELMIMKKGTL
jgi:hypothetical protein